MSSYSHVSTPSAMMEISRPRPSVTIASDLSSFIRLPMNDLSTLILSNGSAVVHTQALSGVVAVRRTPAVVGKLAKCTLNSAKAVYNPPLFLSEMTTSPAIRHRQLLEALHGRSRFDSGTLGCYTRPSCLLHRASERGRLDCRRRDAGAVRPHRLRRCHRDIRTEAHGGRPEFDYCVRRDRDQGAGNNPSRLHRSAQSFDLEHFASLVARQDVRKPVRMAGHR